MNVVKMHGPSISDPSKIVERDVPENDVQVYTNAGYVKGPIPKDEAEADVLEVPAEAPAKSTVKKRGK